jgi:hypothetical protein
MKKTDPYWHIGFGPIAAQEFIEILDRSGLTLPQFAERLHIPFRLTIAWPCDGIDEPWEVAVVRAFGRTGIVVPPVDWLDAAIVRSGLGWGSCFRRMATVTRVPLAVLRRHSLVGAPGQTHGRIYALMASREYRKAASQLDPMLARPEKPEGPGKHKLPARSYRHASLPAPVLAEIFANAPEQWNLLTAADLRSMVRQGVLPRDIAAHYKINPCTVKAKATREHISWLEREVPVVWEEKPSKNLPTSKPVLIGNGVACDAYP